MTRARSWAVGALVWLLGCGGEGAGEPPPPPPVPVSAPAPPPVPAPAPDLALGSVGSIGHADPPAPGGPAAPPAPADGSPEAAYAAMRDAFERGDEVAYFGAFATTLDCYFGRASVPRTELEASRRPLLAAAREAAASEHPSRIESMSLTRARETETEVELVDFGWTGRGGWDATTVFHQKRILLRREGTGWRIVAEGPLSGDACGLPALTATPPAMWESLRTAFRGLVDQCEPPGSTMEEGYPGIGGSNGCMADVLITPAGLCPSPLTRACATDAVAALDRFLGAGMFDVESVLGAE